MSPAIDQGMPKAAQSTSVRVAIITHDSLRLATLREMVAQAGHAIVTPAHADVVLCDEEARSMDKPTLVLGGRDAGHEGWLPLDASASQIDAAVRALAAGLTVRPADDAAREGFEELSERQNHALLTPRELDVLNSISAGHSNKAIARELGISLHTVKFHIESLFRKLGARTRAEAVARALEHRVRETVEL
jgi:DNA-binding CsgD family transcriptional regulator